MSRWLKSVKNKATVGCLINLAVLVVNPVALAGPEEDRQAFVTYFKSRFPEIPFQEFANGIYAIDQDAREQWYEIETFPPYEFTIDEGRNLWEKTFPDGKTYADCFADSEAGVRQFYPKFDPNSGEVETLDTAINTCRANHGMEELKYGGAEIVALSAYMAFVSRGQPIVVNVAEDEPRAMAAYEEGKRFYFTKRGQLNLSCADCHIVSVGQNIRSDRLSASLGHPTHFPVYRSKTGGMVTLHQRFSGCVRDVGAKPFDLQSRVFRNLEYFLTYMSNGLDVNGPGARK